MKKLLLFSILSWALMACTKDNDTSSLTVTPDTPIVFSAAATEVFTLEVSTNQCEWYAVSDQSWCRIIPSGARLTVTAIPNAQNTSPTPATITVRAGNAAPVTIKVTQLAGGGGSGDARLIVYPPDPIQFSAEATESVILDVSTNQGPWNAISDQSWCRVSQGGTILVISALQNELNTPPARATIRVTAGNAAPVLITVTQLASGYVYMPDAVFKEEMLYLYDTNYDGLLSFAEAAAVTSINVYNLHIRSLVGIEAFVNLTDFAFGNILAPTVDLSHNLKLINLNGGGTVFTSINLHGLTMLKSIEFIGSKLTTLDVSQNPNLLTIQCSSSNITSMNLNGAAMLDGLYCDNNKLTTLDVSHNPMLNRLTASDNLFTSLNLNGAGNLQNLIIDNNKLTTLDVSHNPALKTINCSFNQLTTLDVSQNLNLSYLGTYGNPALTTLYMATGQTIYDLSIQTPPTNVVVIP